MDGSTENAQNYIYNATGLVENGTWEIGNPILLNVDDLTNGTYIFRLEVHNEFEFVEDQVIVNVISSEETVETFPPEIILTLAITIPSAAAAVIIVFILKKIGRKGT